MQATKINSHLRRERYIMKRPPRDIFQVLYVVDMCHVIAGKARWRVLPVYVTHMEIAADGSVKYAVEGVNDREFKKTTERIFRSASYAVYWALSKIKDETKGEAETKDEK